MMTSHQTICISPSLAASFDPSAHCLNVAVGITLVDLHFNWLNWFHFLIHVTGLLVILIGCMIFLSPFLDAIRVSMSTQFLS